MNHDEDERVCANCHCDYALRDGHEPSKYCDPCAQKIVEVLEAKIERVEALLARWNKNALERPTALSAPLQLADALREES